jgi:hypothetical protein
VSFDAWFALAGGAVALAFFLAGTLIRNSGSDEQ